LVPASPSEGAYDDAGAAGGDDDDDNDDCSRLPRETSCPSLSA